MSETYKFVELVRPSTGSRIASYPICGEKSPGVVVEDIDQFVKNRMKGWRIQSFSKIPVDSNVK